MNLKKYFTARMVTVDIKSSSKADILKELLEIMRSAGAIASEDLDEANSAILKRESKMSTGMQDGIAIPHARTAVVKDLVAVMGIKREGADFDSLDGKPSNIFIMALSPENHPVPHVQFLAEVSQRLHDAELRGRLLESKSPQELLDTFFEFKKRW
jgi:mannitol/fructose-specific phosphotransferase system IIA component (Ntr-type)